MVKSTNKDAFIQLAAIDLQQSAANTLTFIKLDVVAGAMLGAQKYGMIIHRVETYVPPSVWGEMLAAGEYLQCGLAVMNSMAAVSLEDPAIVTFNSISRGVIATAAGTAMNRDENRLVDDYTSLPGGGLILSADRIYGWVASAGLTNPAGLVQRIFYTMRELSVQDYWDLVESRRIITS